MPCFLARIRHHTVQGEICPLDSIRILAVDDDTDTLKSLETLLVDHDFAVTAVDTVSEALSQIRQQNFDVLLADLNIVDPGDGFALIGAMHQAQPDASAYILAGHRDIGPAIQSIRSQVDGFLAKPLKDKVLLATLSKAAEGQQVKIAHRTVGQVLQDEVPSICDRWFEEVLKKDELAALTLTREERTDHVPDLLAELSRRLEEQQGSEMSTAAEDAARKHGKVRYQQGYTIPQILLETRLLEKAICQIVEENLLRLEFDELISDGLEIGQILQAQLEISIRSYQAQVPSSLQSSFSALYKSPSLGVVIADEYRVIDANDAFLSMIGYSREQLTRGEISWVEMTPEKYRPLDMAAVAQIRQFGACAPFEKEFILADGTMLPFLIGAVRLTVDPLQWSAYVVNLSEQRRLQAIEQNLRESEARYRLISRLAHEVNNPLAALMFSTHLLSTHPDLSPDMAKLVQDATQMLDRVSAVVQRVLEESQG